MSLALCNLGNCNKPTVIVGLKYQRLPIECVTSKVMQLASAKTKSECLSYPTLHITDEGCLKLPSQLNLLHKSRPQT